MRTSVAKRLVVCELEFALRRVARMPISLAQILGSRKPRNGLFYTVAIDGRGGSGKTSLAAFLLPLLDGFYGMNGDDYFEPLTGELAFGGFNDERLRADVIVPLQTKSGFTLRPYDWQSQTYGCKTVAVDQGILIERCYSIQFDLSWDYTIWVETPPDVCLQRGLARHDDQDARHYLQQVWQQVWVPREDEYIKRFDPLTAADLVIDGVMPFDEQFES